MKVIRLIVILLVYTYTATCQELDTVALYIPTFENQDNFTLSSTSDCAGRADSDIKREKARLLICFNHTSESGAFYLNQREFEEEYGITYKLYTCTADNEKCVKKYNKRVLKYLKEKFGSEWRKTIRKDVYGLK